MYILIISIKNDNTIYLSYYIIKIILLQYESIAKNK